MNYINPERGSISPCPYCAIPVRNDHSLRQGGECDGIRAGKIVGVEKLKIRQRNSGKRQANEETVQSV